MSSDHAFEADEPSPAAERYRASRDRVIRALRERLEQGDAADGDDYDPPAPVAPRNT